MISAGGYCFSGVDVWGGLVGTAVSLFSTSPVATSEAAASFPSGVASGDTLAVLLLVSAAGTDSTGWPVLFGSSPIGDNCTELLPSVTSVLPGDFAGAEGGTAVSAFIAVSSPVIALSSASCFSLCSRMIVSKRLQLRSADGAGDSGFR